MKFIPRRQQSGLSPINSALIIYFTMHLLSAGLVHISEVLFGDWCYRLTLYFLRYHYHRCLVGSLFIFSNYSLTTLKKNKMYHCCLSFSMRKVLLFMWFWKVNKWRQTEKPALDTGTQKKKLTHCQNAHKLNSPWSSDSHHSCAFYAMQSPIISTQI